MEKTGATRDTFSKASFILVSAGAAVGLGNIWRFPFLAGTSGGGAFVLVYLILILLIGVSLLLVEFTIGRHGKSNAIDSYAKINPAFKFIGFIGFFSAPMFLSYFSVLSGWTVYYTGQSLMGLTKIPAGDLWGFFGGFISRPVLPLVFHLAFSAATIYVVACGIKGGIEKWTKILMPIFFLFMVVLAIRSLTLPGAMEGVVWFLKPDFSKITPAVVIAAGGQIFFSLSVGMSGMLTYASYLKGNENLINSAGWVAVMDTIVSLIAGLMIFPAVFAFGMQPNAGVGLIFITLPAVFASMPFGAFFSFIFFVMLVAALLTSAISILEMPTAYLVEKKGFARPVAAIIIGGIGFILGIAVSFGYGIWSHLSIGEMTLLDIFDYIGSNLILPLCGLLATIVVGWVWKNRGAYNEVTNGGTINLNISKLWLFIVRFIIPPVIIAIFISVVFLR